MSEQRQLEPGDLNRAIVIATRLHSLQLDKGGQPYILHPLRVMLSVQKHGIAAMCTAVLHDVVEDCGASLDTIRSMFGDEVANAVDSVSRREGPPKEVYADFVKRSAADPIGKLVKIADLKDNLSPERLLTLPKEEQGVSHRYRKALTTLGVPGYE